MITTPRQDLEHRLRSLEATVQRLDATEADRRASRAATSVAVQVAVFLLGVLGMVFAGVIWLR